MSDRSLLPSTGCRRFMLGIGALAFLTSACSTAPRWELPDDVTQQAQARIDRGFHQGTMIGIVDEEGPRYFGFGRISPSGTVVPDERSIFEIGSITKTFTATLLADLDLQGEVDLAGPVEAYVPAFAGVTVPGTGVVTLESLATHTSGLPREPSDLDPNDDDRYATYSAERLDALLASNALRASPGSYAYSNFGVMLLEHAIENAMSTDYESLVRERVLERLEMTNTHFAVPPDKRARLVSGFRDGKTTAEVDLGQFPSMGGLRSTAEDLLTYLAAQVGLRDSALSPAMKATHDLRMTDGEHAMGLGWQILELPDSGKTIHLHKGGTNGFVSFAGFDLEGRRAVVVLVSGRRWFSDLGLRLLDPSYPLADPD